MCQYLVGRIGSTELIPIPNLIKLNDLVDSIPGKIIYSQGITGSELLPSVLM